MDIRKKDGSLAPAHIITGVAGERVAEDYLKTNGYTVICRNYKPYNDEIDIIAHHHDSVLERFALRRTTGCGITKTYDATSQTIDSCLETEACAGRGLKKQCGDDLAFQYATIGILFKTLCFLEQVHDFFFAEIIDRYKTLSFHIISFYC
jgi:hypothetical protein